MNTLIEHDIVKHVSQSININKCLTRLNSSQHCTKQYFQPSMLYRIIIWDNQTQTITGADQEQSIYDDDKREEKRYKEKKRARERKKLQNNQGSGERRASQSLGLKFLIFCKTLFLGKGEGRAGVGDVRGPNYYFEPFLSQFFAILKKVFFVLYLSLTLFF